MKLTLSFSPCPNDCFMFEAIVNRRIDLEGLEFLVQLADIETLNRAAFEGAAEVSKLSFYAYAECVRDYELLSAGGAFGHKCGPLLISKLPITKEEVACGDLTIVIPGKYTTANLLLGLAFPTAQNKTELTYARIESALLEDKFDVGLIIHESRFTYQARGLKKIMDLGQWWEGETGLPLPLGGVVIKRSWNRNIKTAVNRALRRSVEYAFAHPEASRDFVRAHAQEMSDEILKQHIDLYVTRYSVDLGKQGRRAVDVLFQRGLANGIVSEKDWLLNY